MALLSFEQRWAATVARCFVPRGVLGGTTDDIDPGPIIASDYDADPWHAALLLRASIWLVWLAPLWRLFRLRTFGGLDEPAREALLEGLLYHRSYAVRQMANYLKMISCSVLLGNRRVLAHLEAYRLDEPTGGVR